MKLRLLHAALLCTFTPAGCATSQGIPIDCLTQSVEIFVDGQLLEDNPDLLQLSTDEPHKVFIRAEGYEPQLYTFEPQPGEDGEARLTPENVCVQLVPVGQGRALKIEVDEPEESAR